jgi:hypothetical protein
MRSDDFAELAKAKKENFLLEVWDFLGRSKKWWLMPILIAMLGLGALVILSGSGAAPFIYTLF